MRNIFLSPAIILSGAILVSTGCDARTGVSEEETRNILAQGPPYAPEDALKLFEIQDGFRIELFAAEPLVADPLAMEIDEQGRMYVVEAQGYPDNRENTVSSIKLLEDTDGDGLPDKSTVFADGLVMPKGIMRWKDGFIVTDAPDVLYLEDTDGDGRADVRRVVMTGFEYANPQGGINAPTYGLDNWIYLADRAGGREITFPDGPQGTVEILRRGVRFRPDTYEVGPGGSSQFGQTFDAWGRQFLVHNANHLFYEVVPVQYMARNPDLLIASAMETLPEHGDAAEVYAITATPNHELFTDLGVFTAACGITCYLGGAFPTPFEGAVFVAEPAHNLIHVDRLEDAGPSFTAHRIQEDSEFLASRDDWFRPVAMYVGPDGALYVVDYYRDIIEQPRYLSDEVINSGKIYDGSNRGRIYRITPEGGLPLDWTGNVSLGDASTEELVAALDRPNVWWRRNAQRLLVDRKDPSAVASLERVARSGRLAEGRLHALWTLEGMGALKPELIAEALADRSAGVRENAVRLAEMQLDGQPELARRLVAMEEEQDAKVRYQLLLTLGDVQTAEASRVREKLLLDDIEDEWMQVAALTARGLDAGQLYAASIERLAGSDTEGRRTFFRRLGSMIAASGNTQAVRNVLSRSQSAAPGSAWWQAASLEGLAEGLRRRDLDTSAMAAELQRLAQSLFDQDPDLRHASLLVLRETGLPSEASDITSRAASIAQDRERDEDLRADAVEVLAIAGAESRAETLKSLVHAQEPLTVQQAAVRALMPVEGTDTAEFLLEQWTALSPQMRSLAVTALMQNPERIRLLLAAVESERVQPSTIGPNRARSLMLSNDPAIRDHARALFLPREGEGEQVVAQYTASLGETGDAANGAEVFGRACSTCHQIGGAMGVAFGPDLETVRNRRPEFLLADIVLPNREIVTGYEHWTVLMQNGQQVAGIISSETPTAVTLRNMAGQEQSVWRSEIQSMEMLDVSAMPEGLHQQITAEEMVDLIAFLKQPH